VEVVSEAEEKPPLLLGQVEQINLTAAREVTFRLIFNGTPDREALPRLLRLTDQDDAKVDYTLLGQAGSNVVLIQTGTLAYDQINSEPRPRPDHAPTRVRARGRTDGHPADSVRLPVSPRGGGEPVIRRVLPLPLF
jgi:hypothetical protein